MAEHGPTLESAPILVVSAHYGNDGGIGAQVVASVAALEGSGSRAAVVAATADADLAPRGDLHMVAGLDAERLRPETLDRFRSLVRSAEPALVHFHDVRDPALVEAVQGSLPVVWSAWNYLICTSGYKYFARPGDECFRPHGPGCLGNLFVRGCAHRRDPRPFPGAYRRTSRMVTALRRTDSVVACSDFVVRQLRINEIERITTLYPLVPPVAQPSPLPREPRVLFAGRVVGAKGLDTLIRAMPGLDVALDVCGDGWWLPRARRLVERLGLEDAVSFHGWLRPSDLAERYRRASVAVVPSLWPEPFGIVGVEAMAHGRPVVASATGGIPEWHSGERTGALVPPGDPRALSGAIGDLLSDPDRCVELGRQNARAVADRFGANRYLPALRDVYSTALAGSSGAWTRRACP